MSIAPTSRLEVGQDVVHFNNTVFQAQIALHCLIHLMEKRDAGKGARVVILPTAIPRSAVGTQRRR